jgi:uncharacterized protein (TIGR03067 family)
MTTIQVAAFVFLTLAIYGADMQTESEKLAGVWTCVSAVNDGKPLPDDVAKMLRLTITKEGSYKTERGDQVLFDSTYQLDAKQDPPHIDMIGTEGDLKGKAALGIWKLEGEQLTLCYVMPGSPRPTKFESQPQSGTFLVVWKRAEE